MNVKIRFIGIPLLIGLIENMFGCSAPPPQNCALPATGQANWYHNDGGIANCDDFIGFNGPLDVPPVQDGRFMAGCSTEGRFAVDGQAITDNCTGLMWQKTPPGNTMSWIDSLVFARDLTLAGFSDWRLPNVNELLSIVDYGRYSGMAINPVFDQVPSVNDDDVYTDEDSPLSFWSSTSYVTTPQSKAWRVGFASGEIYILEAQSKNNSHAVRAVRGGFIPLKLHLIPPCEQVVLPP